MKIKKNLKRDIFIYIFIVIFLILLIYFVSGSNISRPENNNSNEIINKVTLLIYAPNWNISYIRSNISNISVADLLIECANDYNFSFEKEYFTGYDSYIIDSINGISNGLNNSYWQFYVNGEYANVGCSHYYLKNNDIVEWRFEESPW